MFNYFLYIYLSNLSLPWNHLYVSNAALRSGAVQIKNSVTINAETAITTG